MTDSIPPPDPDIVRFVEALAVVAARRDYRAAMARGAIECEVMKREKKLGSSPKGRSAEVIKTCKKPY